MDGKMDIFPRYLSDCVNKLVYPGKTFENFKNEGLCYIFIMHLSRNNKIYYYELNWTEQYLAHMMNVGKGSQTCNYFHPEKINWSNVHKKLERDTSQDNKKNSDVRIGFKNGDRYLVKADFTFGNRIVEPGTAHIIQTLNVPLVLYVAKKQLPPDIVKGSFPCSRMYLYERKTLHEHGCYRIRPGTNYILYSTQKNFFSLNMIKDTDTIHIPFIDPLEAPVNRVDDIYDKPLKTPYIDDLHETSNNPDLDLLFKNVQPPKEDFVFLKPSDPLMQQFQQIFVPSQATFLVQPTFHEPQQATFHEPQQATFHEQQQTTFPEPQQATTLNQQPSMQQESLNKRKMLNNEQPSMKKTQMFRQKTFYEQPQQETLKEQLQDNNGDMIINDDLTLFDDERDCDQSGWRRNIVVATLEFPKYYQMLVNKQMDDPRSGAPNNSEVCYPLDLSMNAFNNEQLNGSADQQITDLNNELLNADQQITDLQFNNELLNGSADQQINEILNDLKLLDERLNRSTDQQINETRNTEQLNESIPDDLCDLVFDETYPQLDFSDQIFNDSMMEFYNSSFL